MLLGVDVGGTFTDAVLLAGGELHAAKSPTTPEDQSIGVMAAVDAVLERAGARAEQVTRFAHGMTVATNALLEGRGARTALVATEGFTDIVELGRQARAHLYRLCAERPAPLAPPELRFGAPERTGPDGPLRALDEAGARALAERVAAAEPEAVAVVLLHSYRHPTHERALGAALARALPDAHISLSHEVVGTFREYERAATTELDAALSPLLARYLRALAERALAAGLPEPAIMQSSGGLTELAHAAGHAALTVLSGPAAGAAGAAWAAARAGEPDVLCFDMGGTSCDVCVIDGGRVREVEQREVGGRPVALPMLDVHTVGAGGGSIAWRDAGGALRVGPRSAGADPGPACYGRGGSEPTVTDANLVLGHLGAELAGGVRLHRDAARAAVAGLARALDLDPLECAAGIARVASGEMARALRVMTVERGIDPRRYALVAFGGAGGVHAAAIADELELDRIVCPRAGGVLAALGLVVSPPRRDAQRSVLLGGAALTSAAVGAVVAELQELAAGALGGGEEPEEDGHGDGTTRGESGASDPPALRVLYALRYRGQAFELAVERGGPVAPGELRCAFAAAHAERYGYEDPDGEVELVTVRVTATLTAPPVDVGSSGHADRLERDVRSASFGAGTDARERDLSVLRGEPPAGLRVDGPACFELPACTVLVPPGWRARVHDSGAIGLERTT